MNQPIQVIGVGSPIVDLIAEVSEQLLTSVSGKKGGMELIDTPTMESILGLLEREPVKAPGGSAGNTTFALARLGMTCAFLGKLGADDNGGYYRNAFLRENTDGSRFKTDTNLPTACCISLVTPDSERTMRTNLGAAMTLAPDEISADDFRGCSHAHIEGYLLFNRKLMMKVVESAKEADCTISLDLGSFEVVEASRDILENMLGRFVDIVFANEDEATGFCGDSDPEAGLDALSGFCGAAAVKIGKDGAWMKDGSGKIHVPAVPVDRVLDTTGAGDFWAAGFLYGYLNGCDLPTCGRFGSILGGHVVQCMGTHLEDEVWENIVKKTMIGE